MLRCPACLVGIDGLAMGPLADHLVAAAAGSDSAHVRWLNQNLTRQRRPPEELVPGLERLFAVAPHDLAGWIRHRFIAKFFGPVPHPFVEALQHPTRATLLGYVVEHQHFLRQWVRSCAFITARTDDPRVVRYELANLVTEFGGEGPERPSHYELLLRMGESLGEDRTRILGTPPLPATARSIEEWNRMAREGPWLSAMGAMHSLELIAHRDLVREGATVHYFDPEILQGRSINAASKAFLREGYEADVGHSEEALALVQELASEESVRRDVQSTFLRSLDLFDDYLTARLERARDFEA